MVHTPLSNLTFVYSLLINQILSTINVSGGAYIHDSGKRSIISC